MWPEEAVRGGERTERGGLGMREASWVRGRRRRRQVREWNRRKEEEGKSNGDIVTRCRDLLQLSPVAEAYAYDCVEA